MQCAAPPRPPPSAGTGSAADGQCSGNDTQYKLRAQEAFRFPTTGIHMVTYWVLCANAKSAKAMRQQTCVDVVFSSRSTGRLGITALQGQTWHGRASKGAEAVGKEGKTGCRAVPLP